RSPIDFSDKNLEDARHGLERVYETLKALEELEEPAKEGGGDAAEEPGWAPVSALEENFRAALDDDFNTAQALGHVFEAVRTINRVLAEKHASESHVWWERLRQARKQILGIGAVLGLFQEEPGTWLGRIRQSGLAESGLDEAAIEGLIEERRLARKNRDFARADAIRDELAEKGIVLLDSPQGTTWRRK
ncbi:MAG: cysteine--tRNA ligase, partial [Deltaproteobacteria bacterium]|nr:cysteine--tRNA ligase [Deltaproteobacteria bacterium]